YHEQREEAVPEHIEPGVGLGPRTEETAAGNQTGQGQYLRHRGERDEKITARQEEDGAQSRSLESDEQETGRYQTLEPKYRFRNRNEGLDARQRDPGKRDERAEPDKGCDDDSQRTALCIKRRRCGGNEYMRASQRSEIAHITDPDGGGSGNISQYATASTIQRCAVAFPGSSGLSRISALCCDINQTERQLIPYFPR